MYNFNFKFDIKFIAAIILNIGLFFILINTLPLAFWISAFVIDWLFFVLIIILLGYMAINYLTDNEELNKELFSLIKIYSLLGNAIVMIVLNLIFYTLTKYV